MQFYEINLPLDPKVVNTEIFLNNYFNSCQATTCLTWVINHLYGFKIGIPMTKAVHCLTVQPTDHLLSATLFSNSATTAQPKILIPTVNVNHVLFCDLRLVRAWQRWNGETSVTQLSSRQSRQLQLLLPRKKAKMSK